MKKKNHFGEFQLNHGTKNQNEAKAPERKLEGLNQKILRDRMDTVMKQKFQILVEMYMNNVYENGYNASLAFRVIWLFLYSELDSSQFNLIQQINRFLSHQLQMQGLCHIQKCMDLLMIKQLEMRVSDKVLKLWRIKVLHALKKYYSKNHLKKDKRKASFTLRELCRQQLKKQSVKHDAQSYTAILDILLEQQRLIMNSKKCHNKFFQAIENGNNIIRILEKAEQSIIPRYQQQLMNAYWQIAKLHYQLHYITYAKKYAQTTLNIAERINDKKIISASRQFLQNIVTN